MKEFGNDCLHKNSTTKTTPPQKKNYKGCDKDLISYLTFMTLLAVL